MALCGIDTRMLTKRLRNHGTLRGRLCLAPPTEEDFAQIQRIRIDHPVQQVTCQAAYELPGKGKRVAVLDFGLKKSIFDLFANAGLCAPCVSRAYKGGGGLGLEPGRHHADKRTGRP